MSGPYQSTIPVRKRRKYGTDTTCRRSTCNRKRARGRRGFCESHLSAFLDANGVVRGMTDAAPVAEYITQLSDAGIGAPALARILGFPTPSLSRIKFQKFVLNDTAHRILSVELPTSPLDPRIEDRRQVPAIGTVRRLQALQTYGYNLDQIARECGMRPDTVRRMAKQERVIARGARAVDVAFQKLQMIPGTDLRAANRGKRRRWPPPFAWDDIDDPDAKPINPKNTIKGRANAWSENYRELRSLGKTDEQIAERLGITLDSLKMTLRRKNASTGTDKEHQ